MVVIALLLATAIVLCLIYWIAQGKQETDDSIIPYVPDPEPVSLPVRLDVQASEVLIFTGGSDRIYQSLGPIQVQRAKGSLMVNNPTLDEVNQELKQRAAIRGANAVLHVKYSRGMSLTSYSMLTARGEAVVLEADTKVCPQCAETIKRAAIKCRFCGVAFPAA